MGYGRWNDAILEPMRQIGDPLADEVIADVIRKHEIAKVNQIFRSLVENDGIVPDDMPPEVNTYLAQTATMPDWADMALIEQGEEFFSLNWPVIVTLLFCASLPSAYAAWRGAQVLFLTTRLTERIHRRIFETAQFVLNVMSPGAFTPHGQGIRSVQKVRLMHAAIRHLIEYDPRWRSQWDMAWGVPINQEDLAGTLMTFSTEILVGMARFRIPIRASDEKAYFHAWKVVGHIMGIRPDLLPTDPQDAYDLAETIFQRQRGPSEAGRTLTKALVEFMEQQIPGTLFDDFPATIIRHAVDKDVADMLQVPRSNWTLLLLNFEETVARVFDRFLPGDFRRSRILERCSDAMVQEIINMERGGQRTRFTIPASLRAPV
jgi:hypothetical protein